MDLRLPFSAALLIGGVALVFFGLREADSFASDVNEFVTGSPTDRSMWLLAGGAAMAAFGAFLGLTSTSDA